MLLGDFEWVYQAYRICASTRYVNDRMREFAYSTSSQVILLRAVCIMQYHFLQVAGYE